MLQRAQLAALAVVVRSFSCSSVFVAPTHNHLSRCHPSVAMEGRRWVNFFRAPGHAFQSALLPEGESARGPPMWKLVIEDDEGKRTVVPLTRDQYSIGRKEGNTIRLTERNVSREHARIY